MRSRPITCRLYLLELYPNAPLKETMARAGLVRRRPDDEAADMYLAALERLEADGLAQYEISNVARSGRWSRHNVKYWQGGHWRGFGCGAHSTVDAVRWHNVAATPEYVAAMAAGHDVARERRALSREDQLSEALFTGLRLTSGIATRNFLARYGVDPWTQHAGALDPCVDEGLMWHDADGFGLTRRGMLVANEILATFV